MTPQGFPLYVTTFQPAYVFIVVGYRATGEGPEAMVLPAGGNTNGIPLPISYWHDQCNRLIPGREFPEGESMQVWTDLDKAQAHVHSLRVAWEEERRAESGLRGLLSRFLDRISD